MDNQIYPLFSCIMKKVVFQIGTKQRLSMKEMLGPVHYSYRHGRHYRSQEQRNMACDVLDWGGTFDWWWYALLSRVKQIRRVLGGGIIEFALWIILSLLSFFIVHINTVLTYLCNFSFVAITPFFGALLAKFAGGGAQKHFNGRGVGASE